MKKNGWGTMEMIIISSCLLIALIISIIFISKLYGSFENSNNNKIYMDLETELADAGRKYLKENNIEVTNTYRINYDNLYDSNFIGKLEDKNGNLCDGYVLIRNIDNKNYYYGFVSCQDYKTENY